MKVKSYLLLFALIPILLTNCAKEIIEETTDVSEMISEINMDLGEEIEYLEEDGKVSERSFKYFTFSTLNAALECTGLTGALFSGSKTVYAPSDAAFEKLGLNKNNICEAIDAETLTNILLYHVAGEKIRLNEQGCVELLDGNIAQLSKNRNKRYINDSRIYLKFKLKGSNFNLNLYAITDVLTPPSKNIVLTASEVDMFSSLVSAVLAADPSIAAALSNEDAIYTVFAPTNEAFSDLINALGATDLNDLVTKIGEDNLSTVLLYHVVDACAFSNDLKDGAEIVTLQGETVTVDLDNLSIIDKTGTPSNLDASALDILTSNGIVHTIEKVLLPNAILEAL